MFPVIANDDDLRTIGRDDAALRAGLEAIIARHHMGGEIMRFADGSMPVYAIGHRRVLKLYPPPYREAFDTEAAALAAVERRLPIETPTIDAIGDLDGWGYIFMSRLPGESLATAWPKLDEPTRERVLAQLGEAMAALHAIDAPAKLQHDWDAFVAAQRTSAVDRQRKRGLDESWLAQIPPFLDSVSLASPRRAFLHTEVMREHLLIHNGHLSGLFDFEPAMHGAPAYDFASVGVFVSCGEPKYLRAILRAYGAEFDERELLASAIVHRYSHLKWYLERLPPLEEPTLDALARRGWGTL